VLRPQVESAVGELWRQLITGRLNNDHELPSPLKAILSNSRIVTMGKLGFIITHIDRMRSVLFDNELLSRSWCEN